MSMASLYDVNNSQVSVLTKSIGLHGQWGMSTVFDFLEVYDKLMKSKPHRSPETKVEEVNESPNRLNILLMNPGDLRHILCALAKKRRHSFRKEKEENFPEIHFYLLEQNCELMARHLVLLSAFLNFEIPIRQRANTFFEIYGNLKVQRRTKVLIDSLSKELLTLVSSQNSQNAFPSIASVSSQLSLLRQLVNFDMFHYRDFDLLSSALKNYQTSFVYKIDEFFNTRQRGLYEDRYDSRQALYDWDYHQNYKKTATIIHIKTYKHWRETGIGYEFGDQVYNEPNPTFISYTEGIMKKGAKRGEKQEVLGYWGDIVGGPFVSFGINSDSNGCKYAEELYEILNKNTGTEQHRHHAIEVALYNLYCYLWELETGKKYTLTKSHDIYSGLGKEYKRIQNIEIEDLVETAEEKEKKLADETLAAGEEKKEKDPKLENNEEKKEEGVDEENKEEKKTEEKKLEPKKAEPSFESELLSIEQALDFMENIQEGLNGIYIHPLITSNTELLSKSKYQNLFHGAFVSSRFTAVMKEDNFKNIFVQSNLPEANEFPNVIAVETLKYLIPIGAEIKQEYNKKINEYAKKSGFESFQEPPVFIRHRDDKDIEDDVLFFHRP